MITKEEIDDSLNILRRVVMARNITKAFSEVFQAYAFEGCRIDGDNLNEEDPDKAPHWCYMLKVCDIGYYNIAESLEELEEHVALIIKKPQLLLEIIGDDVFDDFAKRRDFYKLHEKERNEFLEE